MPEHWTPEELASYERAIKLYPKQKRKKEMKQKAKIDKLFSKLHSSDIVCNHDWIYDPSECEVRCAKCGLVAE